MILPALKAGLSLVTLLGTALPVLASSKRAFMRVSPLKAGHSNRIEAGNNPVMFTDPAGLFTVKEVMARVKIGYGASNADLAAFEEGLEVLDSTCKGHQILGALNDDNFDGVTLVRGPGSKGWQNLASGKKGGIRLDLSFGEVDTYLGPGLVPTEMTLLESAGMSQKVAIALGTGHELGHVLGTGDLPYIDKYLGVSLQTTDGTRGLENVITHENPLRIQLGVPLRVGYGEGVPRVPGMSPQRILTLITIRSHGLP